MHDLIYLTEFESFDRVIHDITNFTVFDTVGLDGSVLTDVTVY